MKRLAGLALAVLVGCAPVSEPVEAVAAEVAAPATAPAPEPPAAVVEAATPSAPPSSWKEVGGQGFMRLVVISGGDLTSEDTYREAMAGVCKTEPRCIAHFWSDQAEAPSKLPMSDAHLATRVAIWQRNLHTDRNQLLFACRIQQGADCI